MPRNPTDTKDPTIILGKRDENFIETWADRKAKTKRNKVLLTGFERTSFITGEAVKPRPNKDGQLITAEWIKKAKRLYDGQMSVKLLAIEMGCATSTINRMRREFGWTKRKRYKGEGREYPVEMSVHLSKAMLDAVDKRVFDRYRNRSAYIRMLITRNLDL